MATAVIKEKRPIRTASIYDNTFTSKVTPVSFGSVKVDKILPFRVKFSSIGIPNGSGSNVPPIPLQVIGYSNYIL